MLLENRHLRATAASYGSLETTFILDGSSSAGASSGRRPAPEALAGRLAEELYAKQHIVLLSRYTANVRGQRSPRRRHAALEIGPRARPREQSAPRGNLRLRPGVWMIPHSITGNANI